MEKVQKLEELKLIKNKQGQEWDKYQKDLELAIENH